MKKGIGPNRAYILIHKSEPAAHVGAPHSIHQRACLWHTIIKPFHCHHLEIMESHKHISNNMNITIKNIYDSELNRVTNI